jgi:amidase
MSDPFDPDFGSALTAAAALRDKKISSVELTRHVIRRIEASEPKINAYAYQMLDEALESAARADEAIARGTARGTLHGVPANVKESFGVQGRPCTWGIPAFKNTRAERDSNGVQRLREAGAILLGATNVPLHLHDHQSFNDIYGRTNNPWDLGRTPGGSSGGSAASLAAGTTFFSIGSDVGGSIRVPAAFCGVYGHKPTLDIVNAAGHMPGGTWQVPGFSTLLAATGPMARTAADLEAGLRILAGPRPPESKAFDWRLPQARHENMSAYRVGYVTEDPAVPVAAEIRSAILDAVRACERAGAKVKEGWPEGFSFTECVETYFFMFGALQLSVTPAEAQRHAIEQMKGQTDAWSKGALSSFAEWQARNFRRLAYRAAWERYFESTDVFLMPTGFVPAFPHDPTPLDTRVLAFDGGETRSPRDLLKYIAPATLTGCPATAAPAGSTKSGLPVGVQIMGPYLEDATPIDFARLLAREIGGFRPPPDLAS